MFSSLKIGALVYVDRFSTFSNCFMSLIDLDLHGLLGSDRVIYLPSDVASESLLFLLVGRLLFCSAAIDLPALVEVHWPILSSS